MKKIFTTVVYLLLFPAIIFWFYEIAQTLFQNEWVTVIATLAITMGIIISLACSDNSYAASKSIVRNMLIILTCTVLVLPKMLIKNQHTNYFGPAYVAGAIIIAVAFSIYMVTTIKKLEFCWFVRLITGYSSIYLLSEIYIHFGTPFVWIPVIPLTVLLFLFFTDEDVDISLNSEYWVATIVAPIIVGIVSTVY